MATRLHPPIRANGWRRLLEQRVLDRHPVSLLRERLAQGLLAFTTLALGLYWYQTRDSVIRERAIAFLKEMTNGEVAVARAQFSMFGGITLNDVHIAAPYNAALDPKAVEPRQRDVFTAPSVTLLHNPWRLLLGSMRIEQIIVTQPTLNLVHNADTGVRNWRLLFTQPRKEKDRGPGVRPIVTMRQASLRVFSVDADGDTQSDIEVLDADIRPHPQLDGGYCIEIRRLGDPPERTTVVFDPTNSLVTNTPFLDAKAIRLQLPRPYQRFFERIRLDGEVKLTRINYAPGDMGDRHDVIELRNVDFAIPISMWASSAVNPASQPVAHRPDPANEPSVYVTQVSGEMDLAGRRLKVSLSGRIDGAPCLIEGEIEQVDGPLAEAGMNVRLVCDRLPMPEGDIRRHLATDPDIPWGLRNFFRDYDPRGCFDVDCRVRRAVGGGNIAFTGRIRPVAADASCAFFPYRIDGLTGQVRFEDELIFLEDLRGNHGPAEIEIDGIVGRAHTWPSVELTINARQLPFDQPLLDGLPGHYRDLWQRFNLQGAADARIILTREGHDDAPGDWLADISADLLDAQASYAGFPYLLHSLTGRLDVKGGTIQIVGLTGRHGEAVVRVVGEAAVAPGAPVTAAVQLNAQDLALDEDFLAAFSPEFQERLRPLRLTGKANLAGRLTVGDANQETFDLLADLVGVGLTVADMPERVEDLRGQVRVRPNQLKLSDVTGRYGDAAIVLSGDIDGFGDQHTFDLMISARDVMLDQDLYQRLPPVLQQVWDDLRPQGRIHLATRLHATTTAEGVRRRHSTEVTADKISLQYKGFPLAMSDVSGTARVTDSTLEIVSFAGRAAGGSISLSGEIDLTEPGRRGAISVQAKDMRFNNDLLSALPSGLQEAVRELSPKGRFDLALEPLRFETDVNKLTTWHFQGRMTLKDAFARLGIDIGNARGELTGSGRIDQDGQVTFAGDADLRSLRLSQWMLQEAKAKLSIDPVTDTLHIQDGVADAYGGQVAGFSEIKFHAGYTDYSLSVIVRDAQLARLLESHSGGAGGGARNAPRVPAPPREVRPAEKKEEARGQLFGNFLLRGRVGQRGFREGVGELSLREAQVWKLPLALAVFQVMNLAPDENVFHDGIFRFHLNEDIITLSKIDLQGKAMSFVGGGRLDLRTDQLDVTLLAGSPVRLRVPLLTEIVEGAARELMEVRITGTPAKPIINPQPLKSLKKALEKLFPEPPKSRTGLDGARP